MSDRTSSRTSPQRVRTRFRPGRSGRRLNWGSAAWGIALIVVCGVHPAWGQSEQVLEGHTDPVYSIDFSPDGKWIVTGSFDQTLKLWDSSTLQPVRTMTGHTGLVLSAKFSHDGSRLVSGSLDNSIKIWDVPINTPLAELQGHQGAVTAADINADGTLYVSGGSDRVIKVWNAEDQTHLRDIEGNTSSITQISLRRDNNQLASGDEHGVIRLFNPEDGTPQGIIGAHDGEITGLVYAPNNSFLLSSGSDGLVKRWLVNLPESRSIAAHDEGIQVMRLNPAGNILATGSTDKTVRLWNFGNGEHLRNLDGHEQAITALGFSTNNARIATGSADKIARLFDPNNGMLLQTFPEQAGPITAVAVHPNIQEVAVADSTGAIKVYKVEDASELRTLEGHEGTISGLTYTPNGAQIVSAGQDKSVRVWNSADGQEARKIDVGAEVTCLALSANGSLCAVGTEEKTLSVYNLGNGELQTTLSGHTDRVTELDFSRDQNLLASASLDGTARVWDLRTDQQVQHYVRHEGAVQGVAFAPDNRTVITAGVDKMVHIDTVSIQMHHVADEERVNDLAISSNSAQHATAGADGSVKLWNSGNGAPIRAYDGHQGPALSVALSPNNQQIVTGGSDKFLLVWNLNNGQLQYRTPTPAEVIRITFSPDSRKLIAVGTDHQIRNYDPTPQNPQPAEPPAQEEAQVMSGHSEAVHALVFAADNRTALTGSADGTLKTWAVATGGFTANLTGHGSQIYGLAFSPDDTVIASASADKTVRLWDAVEPKPLKTLTTQEETVYSVTFSPDGESLLIAGADNSVRLLNAESGNVIRSYNGPEFPIYAAVFSPDGQTIAAGGVGLGENRKVYLWNIGNPTPTKVLEGHTDDVYCVQFNKNGNRLLTVGYSGSIRIWNIADGQIVHSVDFPHVIYSASYSTDGTHVAVTANDRKTYLLEIPEAAR